MSGDEPFTIETVLADQEQRGNISFPIVGVGASAAHRTNEVLVLYRNVHTGALQV